MTQARLIEDLLDVSRITAGKLAIDMQVVDPATVAEAALDAVRTEAEAKEVRLEQAFELGGGQVPGDPARLQQIVWNLLSNAIKFSARGGRVVLRLARAGEQAILSVQDEGEGIAPDFLPTPAAAPAIALGTGFPTPPQPVTAGLPLAPSSPGFGETPLAHLSPPPPLSGAGAGTGQAHNGIHLAPRPVGETLETVEHDYILAVLQQTNWIINGPRGAAQILGLHPNTLRNRMKKLGIARSDA